MGKEMAMITLDAQLEAEIRDNAAAQDVSIGVYLERLLDADRATTEELESVAIEGIESGERIEVGVEYWALKHSRLDERLRQLAAH